MNKLVAVIFSLLSINAAWSSVIEVDIYGDGTNAGFKHTDIDLVWLDIGETQNQSFNQTLAMTETDGLYEGWRLPTQSEVIQLWESTIGNRYTRTNSRRHYTESPNFFLNEPEGSDWVNYWYSLGDVMGTTGQYPDTETGFTSFISLGIYEADDGLLVESFFSMNKMLPGYPIEGTVRTVNSHERFCNPNDTACEPRDYRNEDLRSHSTMLVKSASTAVPEPSSFAIFSLALVAFMRKVKTKKPSL